MKYFLRFVYIFGITLVSIGLLILSPYFLYGWTLSQGANNSYISLKADEFRVYGNHTFHQERLNGIYYEDDSRWDSVGFTNFIIPFPLHHPQLHLNPILTLDKATGESQFGISFRDQEERNLVDLKTKVIGKFKYDFISKHKLFSLPVFKNYILAKSNSDIWQDLFTRDLSTAFILRQYFKDRSIEQYIGDLLNTPYRELVYGLFIYLLRQEFLPAHYTEITYNPEMKMGIVYIPAGEGKMMQEERAFFLNEGIIYSASIFSRVQSIQAEALRVRLLKSLQYHLSTEADAQSLYNRYKTFEYRDRISSLGMSYLFAAWSHVPDNVNFLKELIYFLERGANNSIPLQTFYQYAYDRYGNNFSQIESRRKESMEEKMKRLKKEELEAELARETARKSNPQQDDFLSDEEKRDYYLQQAKDKGPSDQDDKEVPKNTDGEGVDYITD